MSNSTYVWVGMRCKRPCRCKLAFLLALVRMHTSRLTRYATWRKKTPGAVFLRKIMNKFNMVDHSMSADHWGRTYRGSGSRPLSQIERTRRTSIETSSMQKGKASKIVADLDTTVPFRCRLEFIEALAALSAVFSEDMSRRVTGANPVAHILWCAAEPDRCEWFFNNSRYRHTLSSGLSCSLIGPRDHHVLLLKRMHARRLLSWLQVERSSPSSRQAQHRMKHCTEK